MTATRHASLAKHNQPPAASTGSGTDTKEQLEEYMDMTESSRARALSGGTKEQPEEYMEMNGNNKGKRTSVEQEVQLEEYMETSDNIKGKRTSVEQEVQLEEYMEMTGKAQDSNKIQEDGSMYIDLETAQDYEVPVNRKPSSSDLAYL
jgi:hypothetical protein